MVDSFSSKDKKGPGSLSQRLLSIFRGNSLPNHRRKESPPLSLQKEEQELILRIHSGDSLSLQDLAPLSQEQTNERRRDFLTHLSPLVRTYPIHRPSIETLLDTITDMLAPHQPTDIRRAVIAFLCELTVGQYSCLPLRSRVLNILIKHPLQPDEGSLKVELFKAATRNTRDISQISHEAVAFVLLAIEELDFVSAQRFITTLITFVTTETNDIPRSSLSEIICRAAEKCFSCIGGKELNFLPFFRAVISHRKFPQTALPSLVQALCFNVTIGHFSHESWILTRELIHSQTLTPVIDCLCSQVDQCYSSHELADGQVTRGAILLLSYSLWGPQAQPGLQEHFPAVLPYVLRAVSCNPHPFVWYEICLSLTHLVRTYGQIIRDEAHWEQILAICYNLKVLIFPNSKNSQEIVLTFHQLLNSLEYYCFNEEIPYFKKRPSIVLQLFEEMAPYHNETNVIAFINYKAKGLHYNETQWIEKLYNFAFQFLIQETRVNVRLRALKIIREQFFSAYNSCEELLFRNVIIYIFSTLQDDPPQVKLSLIQFLTELCSLKTSYFDALFSFLCQPLRKENLKNAEFTAQSDVLLATVEGICQTFRRKLDQFTSKHVLLVYNKLIESLENIYHCKSFKQPLAISLRGNLFVTLLSLRADPKGYVGYKREDGTVRYSQCLHCGSSEPIGRSSPIDPTSLPPKTTLLQSELLFERVIMLAFTKENDYGVLQCIFRHLSEMLYNKIWVLSGSINLDAFCSQLIRLTNVDNKILTAYEYRDFSGSAYLALIPTISYMELLTPRTQKDLIVALVTGVMDIKSSANEECLDALTICSLESPATMARYIPGIIDDLKRLSNVQSMAVPILKFLSVIIHVPQLYADFAHQQYMLVLALTKSFTNCQVFTRYVVSLAYQMIGAWFIRARVQFRKKLAAYLVKSLAKNLEECRTGPEHSSVSLPTRTPDSRRSFSTSESRPSVDYSSDLKQACMDMLIRYCYSNTSTHIDRSPLTDFLLSGGQQKTWLVGNLLVTVTTSVNSEPEVADGTCSKCLALQSLNTLTAPLFNQESSEHLSPTARSGLPPATTNCPERSDCSTWCKGWAEVKVRRPTGDCSWLMRIQNRLNIYRTPTAGVPVCLAAFLQDVNLPLNTTRRSSSSDSREGTPTLPFKPIPEEKRSHPPRSPRSPDLGASALPFSLTDSASSLPSDSDRTEHSALLGDSSHSTLPTSPLSPPLPLAPLLSYDQYTPTHSQHLNGLSHSPDLSEFIRIAENNNSPLLPSTPSPLSHPLTKHRSIDSDRSSSQSSSPSIISSALHQRSYSPATPNETKRFRFTPNEFEPHNTSFDAPPLRTSDTDPSFIFLQLYQGGQFGNSNAPILLDSPQVEEKLRKQINNSISVLDHMLPFHNHMFGVVYMDHGQSTQRELLSNTSGSQRYNQFLCGLGEFIDLSFSDRFQLWVGGLTKDDCQYTFHWQDDITQVVFHVATFLSNLPDDPGYTNKKRHIGNDNVIIIYKESSKPYRQGLITSEKTLVEIVIEPLPCLLNKVTVLYKEEIEGVQALKCCYASDSVLAVYVRQLAILSDISIKLSRGEPSNWVARLQLIKKMKERYTASHTLPDPSVDFTIYT